MALLSVALFSLVVFSESSRPSSVSFTEDVRALFVCALPSSKVKTAPATRKQRPPTAKVTVSRISTPLAAAAADIHQMTKSLPDSRVLASIAMYAPKATPAKDARSKRVPMALRIKLTLLYYRTGSSFNKRFAAFNKS